MSRRDWKSFPHLLACYAVLLCAFVAAVAAIVLLVGCEPAWACPDTIARGRLMVANGLRVVALIVIPALALAATAQVVANDLRWRRGGAPRS